MHLLTGESGFFHMFPFKSCSNYSYRSALHISLAMIKVITVNGVVDKKIKAPHPQGNNFS